MGFHEKTTAGVAAKNWGRHFQELSTEGESADFGGGDFGGLELNLDPRATLSDFRPPFAEPDKRVYLLPDAAVPSRPNYDVFGDEAKSVPLPEWTKNVAGAFTVIPHGPQPAAQPSSTVTALTTFGATFGVLLTVLGVVVGAFALGHSQGLHHRKHSR